MIQGSRPCKQSSRDRMIPVLIRMAVWLVFLGLLYLLRSFFLLIFLTFVFSYILSRAEQRLAGHISRRSGRVVLSAILFLAVTVAIGSFVIPRVRLEAISFAERLPTYMHSVDQELVQVSGKYPFMRELLSINEGVQQESLPGEQSETVLVGVSPTAQLLQQFIEGESEEYEPGAALHGMVSLVHEAVARLAAIGSAFLLSLIFSFLIILDLPALAASARSLRASSVDFIYKEVAPSISQFASVLGRALEAQILIALVNTVLTGAGLILLGLGDKVAFLSVIVFFCSFIPVAGVFISSGPICLVALQQGGGLLMLASVAMITGVHLIEAYVLNPRIYGHHLRMNPVVVLIILTVAGKMFHVWGLILGVPVCVYIFNHAIRYRQSPGEPLESSS